MKRDELDIRIAETLKKQVSHPETENEWFTPRVLNKLPEKQHRSFAWFKVIICAVALIACILFWVYSYLTLDFTVITVMDVISLMAAILVSVTILWQCVTAFSD